MGSNAFITGPGRYRKVEEKQSNQSIKFAGRNSAAAKNYDPKTKWVKERYIDE